MFRQSQNQISPFFAQKCNWRVKKQCFLFLLTLSLAITIHQLFWVNVKSQLNLIEISPNVSPHLFLRHWLEYLCKSYLTFLSGDTLQRFYFEECNWMHLFIEADLTSYRKRAQTQSTHTYKQTHTFTASVCWSDLLQTGKPPHAHSCLQCTCYQNRGEKINKSYVFITFLMDSVLICCCSSVVFKIVEYMLPNIEEVLTCTVATFCGWNITVIIIYDIH